MKKRLLIPIFYLLLTTIHTNTFIDGKITNVTIRNHYIQPYNNTTGYKYKTMDGKIWKRLWSYTYNRWEDPEWTLL